MNGTLRRAISSARPTHPRWVPRLGLIPLCLTLVAPGLLVGADPPLPGPPPRHFDDRIGWVSAAEAERFDARLAQFERDTSSQIVVSILPKLPAGQAIEDYTFRIAESWKVGRQDRDNGAVLFVFPDDRKLYIQVGYGLEGVLPDITAKRIIEDEIVPRLRSGSPAQALDAGITALLAAARGEYAGSGSTLSEEQRAKHERVMNLVLFLALLLLLFWIFKFRNWIHRQTVYRGSGRSDGWGGMRGGWGGGGGGGGGGSWGGGGGGGGGFSGGGGSFGGGGAGGSW